MIYNSDFMKRHEVSDFEGRRSPTCPNQQYMFFREFSCVPFG